MCVCFQSLHVFVFLGAGAGYVCVCVMKGKGLLIVCVFVRGVKGRGELRRTFTFDLASEG